MTPYHPITDTTTALNPVHRRGNHALALQLRLRIRVVAHGRVAPVAMEVVPVLL